jgi:hypothetical protein
MGASGILPMAMPVAIARAMRARHAATRSRIPAPDLPRRAARGTLRAMDDRGPGTCALERG